MDAVPLIDAETIARHAEAVRRLAHRLVWDPDRAEDVAQDALVAALEQRAPPRKGLGPWLKGVTRKMAANAQRRERRLRERHARAGGPAPAPAPDDVIERLHAQRLVGEALMAVSEPYRRTLYMRYFDDLPPRAIAEQLGLPVNTVRTHLRRGRARLREEIEARSDKRQPWYVALLPLLTPRVPTPTPVAASAAAGLGGTLLMFAASRYAVVFLVVLLLGSGIAYVTLDDPGDDTSTITETGKVPPLPRSPTLRGSGTEAPAAEDAADKVPVVPPPSEEAIAPLPVRFEGRVLDPTGEALAGVPVKMYAELDPTVPLVGTESDAQGRFGILFDAGRTAKTHEIDGYGLMLRIVASHPRWLFAAVTFNVSTKQEHRATRTHTSIELRFQEPFIVNCRVLDEAARPIEGARCRWGGNGEWTPRPDGRQYEAVTDAEGRAKLEIPVVEEPTWVTLRTTGVKHVHAEAEGYARGISRPIRIIQPTPGQVVEAEIVLPAGHTITGRVIDDRGDPLPNLPFQVALHRRGVPLLCWHENLGKGPQTDASGRFIVENVPAGPWTLKAWAHGYQDFEMPIEVPSQDVTLTLSRKTTIAVSYKRPDGTPLQAGLYRAVRQGGKPFSPYDHARGEDPVVMSRLLPGRYRITVNLIGRVQPFVHDLELAPGPNEAQTITVPEAEGRTVRGRLLGARGEPVEGRVVLYPEGSDAAGGMPQLPHPVGEEGTFRFEGLPTGRYVLWAAALEHAPREQTLDVTDEDAQPVDVRLGRGATVRVRLPRRPRGATFRWQLQLRTACAGTMNVNAPEPDEAGWLEIPWLPVGTTTILLESTSFRAEPISYDPYVAVLECTEGATIEHAFPREGAVTVKGRVMDANGKPRAQLPVTLFRVAPDFDPRKGTDFASAKDLVTDDEGRFEAQGLLPGRYIAVRVRQGGVPVVFEVTEDGEQTVELHGR